MLPHILLDCRPTPQPWSTGLYVVLFALSKYARRPVGWGPGCSQPVPRRRPSPTRIVRLHERRDRWTQMSVPGFGSALPCTGPSPHVRCVTRRGVRSGIVVDRARQRTRVAPRRWHWDPAERTTIQVLLPREVDGGDARSYSTTPSSGVRNWRSGCAELLVSCSRIMLRR